MSSPDRPVPESVQIHLAQDLAMAEGYGPGDFDDTRAMGDYMRQASVVLDSLRCLESDDRAKLLADWAAEAE